VPGVDLGAPDIAWKAKNPEQKSGFMAAAVEPRMEALFVKHDKSYARSFNCATCHGDNGESVDWEMPNPALYALPKEDTVKASTEYDEDVTKFMVDSVTPELKKMLNEGHGGTTEVSCFSCHPAE
jgi:cytochrome c553